MATHFKNEIKRKGTFKDVFWVTVSDDFTTFKLQHDIAETIQVKKRFTIKDSLRILHEHVKD